MPDGIPRWCIDCRQDVLAHRILHPGDYLIDRQRVTLLPFGTGTYVLVKRPEGHAVVRILLGTPGGAERPGDPGQAAGDLVGNPGHAGNEGAGGERDDRGEAMAGGVMRANVGDLLVLPGNESRIGLVIGVAGKNGAPPYVIKWLSDGHIAMVTPDPYARIVPSSDGTRPEQLPQGDQ